LEHSNYEICFITQVGAMVYGLMKTIDTVGFDRYNCVSKSKIFIKAEDVFKEIT